MRRGENDDVFQASRRDVGLLSSRAVSPQGCVFIVAETIMMTGVLLTKNFIKK